MKTYSICLCLTCFYKYSSPWSIHIITNGRISFNLVAESYSIVYNQKLFIHSYVDGHVCCFQILVSVNSDA